MSGARHAPVAEWYTRQVEGLCPQGRGGSSPLGGTQGRVRTCGKDLPHVSSFSRAASSVGRASALHAECQGFESLAAHLSSPHSDLLALAWPTPPVPPPCHRSVRPASPSPGRWRAKVADSAQRSITACPLARPWRALVHFAVCGALCAPLTDDHAPGLPASASSDLRRC